MTSEKPGNGQCTSLELAVRNIVSTKKTVAKHFAVVTGIACIRSTLTEANGIPTFRQPNRSLRGDKVTRGKADLAKKDLLE